MKATCTSLVRPMRRGGREAESSSPSALREPRAAPHPVPFPLGIQKPHALPISRSGVLVACPVGLLAAHPGPGGRERDVARGLEPLDEHAPPGSRSGHVWVLPSVAIDSLCAAESKRLTPYGESEGAEEIEHQIVRWRCNASGRAPASQAEGRGFESHLPLQPPTRLIRGWHSGPPSEVAQLWRRRLQLRGHFAVCRELLAPLGVLGGCSVAKVAAKLRLGSRLRRLRRIQLVLRVSILARPAGRALPAIGETISAVAALSFNPRPARRPGATWYNPLSPPRHRPVSILARPAGRALRVAHHPVGNYSEGFNPRPARRPGATPRLTERAGRSVPVSILARPAGRALPSLGAVALVSCTFQSSPGLQAGVLQ